MAETEPRPAPSFRAAVTTGEEATGMHAVVQSEYGGPEVLTFADVEKPAAVPFEAAAAAPTSPRRERSTTSFPIRRAHTR